MSRARSAHDLEQLKKLAKTLLKSARAGDPKATIRFAILGLTPGSTPNEADSPRLGDHPDVPANAGGPQQQWKLADAQRVIARERGFQSWRKLRLFIEEHVADDFFSAVDEGRVRKIKRLLDEFPRVASSRNHLGLLPIQVAIQSGHAEIQRLLLDLAKPRSLNTSKFLPFENGKGHHIWDMINASITGDLGRIRLLVEECPSLVNCYYDYQTPLHLAVAYGHSNVVKYLLEQGADVAGENYPFHDSLLVSARDRQDSQIVELLSKAVRKRFPYYEPGPHSIINDVASGNVKAVQNRLSNSSNHCNVCEEDGNTPLHVAARNLDVALVALLLGRGADANAANKEGFKPIHVALYRNNYWYHRENGWECAELLLRHTEPNINLAATFGDLERVRNSLRNEPKLANFCDSCDKRPISSAAARGHVGIVRVLLDAGADVTLAEANAPNGFALWAAARGGHIDCARLLLEAGANPHAPVESSGTAFTAAEGNKLLLDLLRQYAREPTEPDPEESDGLDPVSGAIMRNDIDSLRCFLDKDPTLVRNPAAFYGEGYLAFAASRRNMGIVDLLLERGARVPDRSNWGAAYAFKHNDVARKLLEHGASPNHRNWLERTVLHEFSYRGYLDKLELLIEFGAEVNAIDMEYQSTPLGFAARGGQTDAVELLLKAGADPELPSSPVWARPKAWAQSRGHSDLSRTLQSNKQ